MKKPYQIVLFLMLFWLVFSQKSYCCFDVYPTHNYYMVSFAERKIDRNPFQEEIDAFWKNYTQGKYSTYPTYDVTGLKAYIKSLDDNEMLNYVKDLK
jgi:hypothetical protein